MPEQKQTVSLYVRKSTDLMLPILMTYGVAELVYQILPERNRKEIYLRDLGHAYCIDIPLTPAQLHALCQTNALPHLIPAISKPFTKSEMRKIKSGTEESDIIERYIPRDFSGEQIRYVPIRQQTDDENDIWDDARYPIWAHICSHFIRGKSMTKTYPLAVHIWHAHQKSDAGKAQLLQLIMTTLADVRMNLSDTASYWSREIKPILNYGEKFEILKWSGSQNKLSLLSLISPGTVRGQGSADIGNSFVPRQPEDFWLIVYLGLAGFVHFSFPYKYQRDVFVNILIFGDDCKYLNLRELVSKCRKGYHLRKAYTMEGKSAHQTINLYHLLNYFTFMESQHIDLNRFKMLSIEYKYVKSHIPGGFQIYRVGWYSSQDSEYVGWIKFFFSQIQTILQVVESDRTNFTELILKFVQSGSLDDCLRFLESWYSQPYEAYSQASFALSQISRLNKICKPEVNRSMSTNYSKILENPGFLSIARAINHCTTYAAYIEGETEKTYPFKIRKDLRRELLHVRHDHIAFIDKLGEFIIDYQDESGELRKKGHIRHKVSLEDVTNMMGLIDEFGIEIVSRLLLIAGYVTHYPSGEEEIEQTEDAQS